MLFSLSSKGANLSYKPVPGGYLIFGSINKNDMSWSSILTMVPAFQARLHETGVNFYENKETLSFCPAGLDDATAAINDRLKQGIPALTKTSDVMSYPEWTVLINCRVIANAGGWKVQTYTPSPPNGAICDTSVPLKVSFGNVEAGSTNNTTVMDGTIKCDRDADVSLSFKGFDDGYIPIQDAKVKFKFDNGLPNYKLTAEKGILTNFKINFEAISTGTTTGYKSASAILVMQWQ